MEVSAAKSLNSRNGSFEFAKRFVFKGTDASPLAFKEYDVAIRHMPTLLELVRRNTGDAKKTLTAVLHALGFGFRSISRANARWNKMGGRLRGALLILRSPKSSLGTTSWEEWLSLVTPSAVGPFSDSVRSRVGQSLRAKLEPRLKELFWDKFSHAFLRVQFSPLKEFCNTRAWITGESRWDKTESAKAETAEALRKQGITPALILPGARLWETLIAKPVLTEYAAMLRELVGELTGYGEDSESKTSRHLMDPNRGANPDVYPEMSIDDYVRDALNVESNLGLLVSSSQLTFPERGSASKLVDRSSGKLLRLFKAMRKVSRRSNTQIKGIRHR